MPNPCGTSGKVGQAISLLRRQPRGSVGPPGPRTPKGYDELEPPLVDQAFGANGKFLTDLVGSVLKLQL